MTDRIAGFVVSLEHDTREDDVQAILSAIRHIKGVVSVEPVIAEPDMMIAAARVRADLVKRLWKALDPVAAVDREEPPR